MTSPSSLARRIMAIACLIGLFASTYLLYTYVTGARIACGIVSGCDLVRSSPWAWTFGIPRPLLGVVFYIGVLALLIIRSASSWQAKRLHQLTMLAAVLGFIESAFLFLIQWLDVKAFCLWCLTSGIAATVILLVAIFDRPETDQGIKNKEIKTYFIFLLIFLILSLVGFRLLLG